MKRTVCISKDRRGVVYVRTYLCGVRKATELVGMKEKHEPEALRRGQLIFDLSARIEGLVGACKVGPGWRDLAKNILDAAGESGDAYQGKRLHAALNVIESTDRKLTTVDEGTFGGLAEAWLSGDLAKRYPDRIDPIAHPDIDRKRLKKHVFPKLGKLSLALITLDHVEDVMTSLPPELSQSSRRTIAALMSRVFNLAVFPLRTIKVSPIPKGFLPNKGAEKAKNVLFPDEIKALLACTEVPLDRRVLYGWLMHEGMRKSEARRMDWTELDLARGWVDLDVNKTGKPRSWALQPSTRAAMTIYKAMRGGTPRVFGGLPKTTFDRLATFLRADLTKAGVNRKILFEESDVRMPMRGHDLRAVFVSYSLAAGKTDSWVRDRTGHTTTDMMDRYRRTARALQESGAGGLEPLNLAIPELVVRPCELVATETQTEAE